MARRGRPTVEIALSPEERATLERWARRHSSSQALALRSKIVLGWADGKRHADIAAELGCNPVTVGKWRARFARRGFDGLHDEPRPGKPRSIGDEEIERVIVKTLEESQPNATHWSTRSMAAATGMSQTAISRIWRAFALRPHQTEAFKLSPDPQFIDKVRAAAFECQATVWRASPIRVGRGPAVRPRVHPVPPCRAFRHSSRDNSY